MVNILLAILRNLAYATLMTYFRRVCLRWFFRRVGIFTRSFGFPVSQVGINNINLSSWPRQKTLPGVYDRYVVLDSSTNSLKIILSLTENPEIYLFFHLNDAIVSLNPV